MDQGYVDLESVKFVVIIGRVNVIVRMFAFFLVLSEVWLFLVYFLLFLGSFVRVLL